MSETSTLRAWVRRVTGAVAILAAVLIVSALVTDQVRLRLALAACRSADPGVRAEAFERLARERESRAWPVVARALEEEQDRGVLNMAGYAAVRLDDTRLLERLHRRASVGPDDAVRARLTMFTARLSRRDVRLIDWLVAGVKSSREPWRQMGSAAGLLDLGQPRGGPALIAIARRADHPARAEAMRELQRLVQPMTETVGWPVTWPGENEMPAGSFWASLEAFWDRHGDARLLNDVLTRRYDRNPRVAELLRLLHAREKVARWFE